MKTGFFRILFALICIFLLYGCAVIDKQLLVPASQHAKVNPLFRTADCKEYEMPTNGLIREIFMPKVFGGKAGGGFFVKDPCEHQALAINDISEDPGKTDNLYSKMCPVSSVSSVNSVNSVNLDNKFGNEGTARNCLNYLISKSNEICELHKSHIYGDRTVANTILGTLALGAGIAGTMTGAGAAHFLAGSAGFLTGSQALMDKEIYRNFVFHAILVKIDANRSKFLKSPRLAYLDENNSDKSIGYAKVRNDAAEYHNLCSFYDGLKSLMDEAGVSKTEVANPLLIEFTKQRKQSVENEIKTLEAQLDDPKIKIPEEKRKKMTKDLDHKKGQLDSLKIQSTFMGERITTPKTEQPKDETGEKTDSDKKADGK